MRSTTSCCTPAENCQRHPLAPAAENLRIACATRTQAAEIGVAQRPALAVGAKTQQVALRPEVTVGVIPRSRGARHDALRRIQSVAKDDVRVIAAKRLPATHLPNEPFSAVLPVPNRSHAMPARGEMSCHEMPSVDGGRNCGSARAPQVRSAVPGTSWRSGRIADRKKRWRA